MPKYFYYGRKQICKYICIFTRKATEPFFLNLVQQVHFNMVTKPGFCLFYVVRDITPSLEPPLSQPTYGGLDFATSLQARKNGTSPTNNIILAHL